MEEIKVLWMNNGDDTIQKYVALAKEYNINITTCGCMRDCWHKLDDSLERWDAVILNMEVKTTSCNEKASSISSSDTGLLSKSSVLISNENASLISSSDTGLLSKLSKEINSSVSNVLKSSLIADLILSNSSLYMLFGEFC